MRVYMDSLVGCGDGVRFPAPTPTSPPPRGAQCVALRDVGHALRTSCQLLGRSEKTANLYVSWARRFIMFHHNTHPADLEARDVVAFITHLKRPSGSTQNQAVHALCFLYQHVLHTPLPLASIKPLRAKRHVRLPEPVQPTTLAQFLRHLSGTPRLVALLQVHCGLRLEEALALRVSDLHLASKTLVVRGQRERLRELPIPINLANLLRRVVERLLADRDDGDDDSDGADTSSIGDSFVFTGSRRGRLSDSSAPVQARTIRRAYQAVRPPLSSHALRQCYAIQQLDQGVNLVLVHQRLGQRDIHTTLRYASVSTCGVRAVRSPADDLESGLR